MSKEIATTKTVNDVVLALQPQIKMALGDQRLAERFARVALTAIKMAPNLSKCTHSSISGAIMMGAQLALDFSVGQAYIIPYHNKNTGSYEAQFQLGYQGLIELFYRHNLAKSINVEEVYKTDEFELVLGTDRHITHRRDIFSFIDDEVVGFYATAELKTGARNFAFISLAEAKRLQERYGNTWRTNLIEMAKKTAIKRVLKIMPKSTDILTAMSYDDSIRRPITIEQAGNINEVPPIYPDEIEYQEAPQTPVIEKPTPRAKAAPKAAPKTEVSFPELPPEAAPIDEPPLPDKPRASGLEAKKEEILRMVIDTEGISKESLSGWETLIEEAESYGDLARLESNFRMKYKVVGS